MLDQLKFVMRGVARRDIVPGLTHFRISGGHCVGHNGTVALSAPVDIGFDVAPHAGAFIRALQGCEDVITLKMEGNDLLVRSGAFRVLVPCIPLDSVPVMVPEGRLHHPHGSLLSAFEALEPFIGVDASRPWALGVLLANQSAYATNNIVIAECWLGEPFPAVVNVPSATVEEVVRIHEEMSAIQIAEGTITFHFTDQRWVKSPVLGLDWPDVPKAMAHSWSEVDLQPVPPGLLKAVEKIAPFCTPKEEHVYFRGNDIATTKKGIITGAGAFEISVHESGCYHVAHLTKVLGVATHADFTRYPSPIPFMGGNLRGAMLGVIS